MLIPNLPAPNANQIRLIKAITSNRNFSFSFCEYSLKLLMNMVVKDMRLKVFIFNKLVSGVKMVAELYKRMSRAYRYGNTIILSALIT